MLCVIIVFDGVPDNVMVKTEPSSPKEMRTEEEFSLYEVKQYFSKQATEFFHRDNYHPSYLAQYMHSEK